MSVRLHLYRDEEMWILAVARVTEEQRKRQPISRKRPSPDQELVLDVRAKKRSTLLWATKLVVLHEMLERKDGPGHRCEFCIEIENMEAMAVMADASYGTRPA